MKMNFSRVFSGAIASLLLIFSAQAHAATYAFDTPVIGTFASGGTVSLSANGSTETFVVTLPAGYSFNEFALNRNAGATVTSSSAYTVSSYPSWANFYGGSTFGPFNTVLTGNFGNSLTFTITNYTGIYNLTVNGQPIWFLAAAGPANNPTWAIAADAPVTTPLPATLPLFASGLGAIGLLSWRAKRKRAAVVDA